MKLRLILPALLSCLVLTESAFALSCARPDLIKTLEDAKASENTYHILVGQFVGGPLEQKPDRYHLEDVIKSHPENQFKPKPPIITKTFFEGYSLSNNPPQDVPLTRYPVDIETRCAGPWCGSLPERHHKIIAFVQAREGQAPLLRIGPCPSNTFTVSPEEGKVEKIRQCLDRTCQSDTPHR